MDFIVAEFVFFALIQTNTLFTRKMKRFTKASDRSYTVLAITEKLSMSIKIKFNTWI